MFPTQCGSDDVLSEIKFREKKTLMAKIGHKKYINNFVSKARADLQN